MKETETIETVTRLEIIDSDGRAFVRLDINGVTLSLQDDSRTLKVFIEKEE